LGVGGLGMGYWALGPIPNPQSPISSFSLIFIINFYNKFLLKINLKKYLN